MWTALDVEPHKLDDAEQRFVSKVREHGWCGTNVFAEGELPGFSYTTGFWRTLSFPELIVFSLKGEVTNQIFWNLFKDIQSDRTVRPQRRIGEVLNNMDIVLLPVSKRYYEEHLGWSRWFYGGNDFLCLQLIWPDRENRFPWQPGFDRSFASDQPDLTEDGWEATKLVE